MKKLLAVMLAGIMAVSMTACSDTKQSSESTEKKQQFVVGFDAEFPPYGYLDSETNEYVGFDLDLAAEVCERNDWELVKFPMIWDTKDAQLDSGAIDCIWNGFTINTREDDYTWSEPYVDNSQVFVVLADSGIKEIADLKDKVVLVQADSSALHALESDDLKEVTATFKQLQQVPEYNTAFMDMEAGAADAVAMDIGVANYQIESKGDKFVILEEKISTEQYGIGFKLGNEELRDKVQATLDEMVEDGTFAKIAEEWDLTDSVCLGK